MTNTYFSTKNEQDLYLLSLYLATLSISVAGGSLYEEVFGVTDVEI
jgi:hypothetical protein